MKLSKEEEQLILERRQQDDSDKVKRVGYLNRDLYQYDVANACSLSFRADSDKLFWLCDEKQKKKWKKKFNEHFKLVLKKGTQFVCFIWNGKENWYDNVDYGIECMDDKWALEYLENISDVK